MLKSICLTIIGVLVAGVMTLTVPPANAVTYVDVVATGVTLEGAGCKDAYVDVYGDWVDSEITVSVTDPNGFEIAYDTFYDTTGTLNLYLTMCGSDPAGTYNVSVEVYDYNDGTSAVGSDTFTVKKVAAPSKAKSKITVKREYRPAKVFKWRVQGKLTRAGKAYKRQRVELQARINGSWWVIDAVRTNRRGLVGWEFKPNRFRWRFHFDGNSKTKPSNSDSFRTPWRTGRLTPSTRESLAPESLVEHAVGTSAQRDLTRR